jgi:hypothetical protein
MDFKIAFAVIAMIAGFVVTLRARDSFNPFDVGFIGFVLLVVGAVCMSYIVYKNYGTLTELDTGTSYAIRANVGFGKALVLYDLSAKRNRLAEIKQYPPDTHKESKMADGEIILVPDPTK